MAMERITGKVSNTSVKEVRKKTGNVILEVTWKSEQKRFVIPYKEWLLIEKWYCSNESTDDYLLKLRDSNESYRIVRLNKEISQMRILEISHSSIVKKNISHILFSSIPGPVKFIVPLCIVLILWGIMGIVSLIQPVDIIGAATKLTSLVFVLFLLLNIQFGIIKTIEALKNKYEAFIYDNEEYLPDTLIFNTALLLLFVVVGPRNIISLIKALLNYISLIT